MCIGVLTSVLLQCLLFNRSWGHSCSEAAFACVNGFSADFLKVLAYERQKELVPAEIAKTKTIPPQGVWQIWEEKTIVAKRCQLMTVRNIYKMYETLTKSLYVLTFSYISVYSDMFSYKWSGSPWPPPFLRRIFFVKIPLVNPLFKSVSCVPPPGWGPFSENP